jgi:hypothetical protein
MTTSAPVEPMQTGSLLLDADQRTASVLKHRIGPTEVLITLTEAAKHLPKVDGKKVSVCTIWRWCRVGLRGIFLEYVRCGRTICTTREALLRFFSDLADQDEFIAPDTRSQPRFLKRSPITTRQRQRALAEADAILEKAGI